RRGNRFRSGGHPSRLRRTLQRVDAGRRRLHPAEAPQRRTAHQVEPRGAPLGSVVSQPCFSVFVGSSFRSGAGGLPFMTQRTPTFRTSDIMRLMSMLMMLAVLGMLIMRARDASTWRWLANKDETADQEDISPQPRFSASTAATSNPGSASAES